MWGKISGILGGLFNGIGSGILSGLSRLANGAANAAGDVWAAIQSLINTAIQALSAILDALHGAVSSAWSILTGAFGVLEQGFNELISSIFSAVTWLYRVGLPGIYSQLKAAFDAVANLAQNIGAFIADKIAYVVDLIADSVGKAISFIIDNAITPILNRLGIHDTMLGQLWAFVHGLLDDARNFAKWLVFPLIDVLIDGWETIAVYAGRAIVGLFIRSFMQFPHIVEEILAELL